MFNYDNIFYLTRTAGTHFRMKFSEDREKHQLDRCTEIIKMWAIDINQVHTFLMSSAAYANVFYHSNDDTAAGESNVCWFISPEHQGPLISMYSGIILTEHCLSPQQRGLLWVSVNVHSKASPDVFDCKLSVRESLCRQSAHTMCLLIH